MKMKKQTVWLVSMLSLMVVLSAYYLFTDDMETSKLAKNQNWDQVVTEDLSSTATPSVVTTTDDYFADVQMERDEKQEAEFDRLMETLDTANEDVAATTMKTLEDLQDKAEKVIALEEQLAIEFKNAVITEKEGNWDVVVQAKALEKTQAVSIIERVMAELKLRPDQITIHSIKQ